MKKEPATKRMREYTDLGLDLGERNEHVACHASGLALALTDKACQKAQMQACHLPCLSPAKHVACQACCLSCLRLGLGDDRRGM